MVEEDSCNNKLGESIKLGGSGHIFKKPSAELTRNEARIEALRDQVMLIERQHEKSKETIKKIQKHIRYRPIGGAGQGHILFTGDSENEQFLRGLGQVQSRISYIWQ